MISYLEITKPRITWLILMSTAVGYFFGSPYHSGLRELAGITHWWHLFHAICGTGLVASGTAALNEWYEREADAKMRRTSTRPIPSGKFSPVKAFAFGALVSVVGLIQLTILVNWLSGLLAFATLSSYLFLYTPLKRRSWWCTTIGAVPGAMPPLIGYAAAKGALSVEALALFGILFLWQFPHFYSIAWMYRDDYRRAGIRMLPVTEPDCKSTARQMVLFAAALLVFSLVPTLLNMTGLVYAVAGLMVCGWLLYVTLRAAVKRTIGCARDVLRVTIVNLPVLYLSMVLNRISQ